MPTITIIKGADWSVVRPVYQQKTNYELWRMVRTSGSLLQYWEEFEQWKATGGETEEAFIESVFAKCAPGTDVSVDLTGCGVTYKIINGGGSVIARPTVYSSLPDVDGSVIDLFQNGRIGLYLPQSQVDSLPVGTYYGVATFTNGTLTREADTDTIILKAY